MTGTQWPSKSPRFCLPSFTRRFASAIDDDDNVEESWPRGSGRPSTGRI